MYIISSAGAAFAIALFLFLLRFVPLLVVPLWVRLKMGKRGTKKDCNCLRSLIHRLRCISVMCTGERGRGGWGTRTRTDDKNNAIVFEGRRAEALSRRVCERKVCFRSRSIVHSVYCIIGL